MLADFIPHELELLGTGSYLIALDLTNPAKRWRFHMPTCIEDETAIFHMELLCEPGPLYKPSPSLSSPFHVARGERLIVLIVHVVDERGMGEDYPINFYMLSSRLLACLKDPDQPDSEEVQIPWADWGRHCRAIHSSVLAGGSFWPCAVYGTKHVIEEDGQATIYDFNQASVHSLLSSGGDPESLGCVVPSNDLENNLFEETVTTSLPYRKIKTGLKMAEHDCPMFGEDSFMIVEVRAIHCNSRFPI